MIARLGRVVKMKDKNSFLVLSPRADGKMKIVGRQFFPFGEIDAVDAQPRSDGGKREDMLPFGDLEPGKQQPDPLELRAVSKEAAFAVLFPS